MNKVKGKPRWMPFGALKDFAISANINSITEWKKYWKTHERPKDIPAHPEITYKKTKEWTGWGDFLDTGNVHNADKEFLSYKAATKYMASTSIRTQDQFKKWSKTKERPANIPGDPATYYKAKGTWKTWPHFLNSDKIANQNRKYISYEDLQRYVKSNDITSKSEWYEYWGTHKKPDSIPLHPNRHYKKIGIWENWGKFTGTNKIADQYTGWSIERVKETLRGIIDSGMIYQMDEARLYSLMKSDGLLNLDVKNRHSELFKSIIQNRDNIEFMKQLDEYAHSDSKEPPIPPSYVEEEIKTAKPTEELADGKDELDFGEIATPEQIFKQTEGVPSICVDEEKMKFQVACSVRDLWKTTLVNEAVNVEKIESERKTGNRFHDEVKEKFLEEHEQIQQIRRNLPEGYQFNGNPTTMQLYVAMRMKKDPYFANLSTTGTGKTLSAILASRVIDAKLTVVVCPNDIVEQWEEKIIQAFPDSVVKSSENKKYGKAVFREKREENKHKYLVINYDKFSQDYSDNEVSKLVKQKIDLLIFDEIQYAKKTGEEEESKRHRLVLALRTNMRETNRNSKVLGMSATPIINNLVEGKEFLHLLTGEEYKDLKTIDTTSNAIALYEKLVPLSIRERRPYNYETRSINVQVPYKISSQKEYARLKSNPLHVEKLLTPARIPEIIKNIEGKTIIYTQYVGDGIVQELTDAVEKAGYSTAHYTGIDKTGIEEFARNGKQVLIASKPISVGVDGLQTVCNRLIINTLPWTNAQYVQLIGRIAIEGQVYDKVNIILVKASLGPVQYDETYKMGRIRYKKTVADCAVDGVLPRKGLATPAEANKAAIEMLERLNRGEISTVQRPEILIELTPAEIEKRIAHMGDISKIHQRFNTEKSETTHERLKKNPEELIQYLGLLETQQELWRKTHGIVPYEMMIKRIKELSPRAKIADFGCGKAHLVKELGKDRVYSFDHVPNENVTPCNMAHSNLSDGDIDIAVFSQSLMGVDWPDYIKEAKRCLAKNGYLFIAEATDQLENGRRLATLQQVIRKEGFDIYSEEKKAIFTFIEARKL